MAGFRQHVLFSSALGAGYALILDRFGYSPGDALLAGGLCGLAGMLPDMDSDTGTPIKEIFGLLATVTSLFVFHRLRRTELDPTERILMAALSYAAVRFGLRWVFAKFTVHRGIWHSLPVALLLAELTFLAGDDVLGESKSLALGGGVLLGFLSHLLLDEIYSFEFQGLMPRFKSSHGTALKLVSENKLATIGVWLLLGLVTYQSALTLGLGVELLPNAEQSGQAAQAAQAAQAKSDPLKQQ